MGNITTVSDIIRVHGKERAQRTALVQGDRRLTWAQLYSRARQMSNLLAEHGVGPQDRVAFLDKNGIEHFEVFYGAALLNAVCVDVNWRLAAPEVEYIVNDAEAKVFVRTRIRLHPQRHRAESHIGDQDPGDRRRWHV